MRKKTLYSVCLVLSMGLLFLLRFIFGSQGIKLPWLGEVSPLVASLILVPVLIIPLAAVNQRILAWRKAKGRDIEAEEKHEFDDADIISLRPRQTHESSSTYRR